MIFCRGVSSAPRILRTVGSSDGARLVARQAGLSRREKCFTRTTSKPHRSSRISKSLARKFHRCRGTSRPLQLWPSRRNCQQAAFGVWIMSRPDGCNRECADFKYSAGTYKCSRTWNIVIAAQLPAGKGAFDRFPHTVGIRLCSHEAPAAAREKIQTQYSMAFLSHHSQE